MHIKLGSDLYLNWIANPTVSVTKVATAVNHIWVVDCSGSMSYDLPMIRAQLKELLPRLLSKDDTVSIIWFSGKGQCGVLLEGVTVADLTDLQMVNQTIDRWLKPVGLTGFVDPLKEIDAVQDRVAKKTGNQISSVFFMSDGCDNQSVSAEISRAAEKIHAHSVTVVEYGYYADTRVLANMATLMGGSLISAADFSQYKPVFEAAVRKSVVHAPMAWVEIDEDAKIVGDFAFALAHGELFTFSTAGQHLIGFPAHLDGIYAVSRTPLDDELVNYRAMEPDALYAALSLYATRMMPDVVYPILRTLGDVQFIEQYSKCFGKDKYTAFQQDTLAATFDPSLRLVKGYDPNAVPRDDAFSIFELLQLLGPDDRLMLDHPLFKLSSRLSRRRESTVGKVDPVDVETMKGLIDGLTDAASIDAAMAKLAEIGRKAATPELKFIPDPVEGGYPITGLVIPEERANISIRVRKTGHVDLAPLAAVMPVPATLPSAFDTFIWRNTPIITNGLVNASVLPVSASENTRDIVEEAIAEGRLSGRGIVRQNDGVHLFYLEEIPLINRGIAKAPSAKQVLELEWRLLAEQAMFKVCNHYRKELFPKESVAFAEEYGKDTAEWLEGIGISDRNGFAPKGSKAAESTDFYMAKEMKVSIAGFSSLPSVNDVKKRIESGKMTPAAKLMVPHVEMIEGIRALPLLEDVLNNLTDGVQSRIRTLQLQLAQIKFAVLVGQVWFTEFESLEEGGNKLEIEIDGEKITGKFEQRLVEVKI